MHDIPHTDEDRRAMLDVIGVASMEHLFLDIPQELRLARLNVPSGMSELEIVRHLRALAAKNAHVDEYVSFLGAGAYDHFIPSVVRAMTARGEFATAYTPYQPEVSQGTLQAIFEYQSLICGLTGMDVSNASMYDGASALAEAAFVALNARREPRGILAAQTVHPEYRATVRTYLSGRGIPYEEIPFDPRSGVTDSDALRRMLSENTAGVLIQHPNFFGALEPMSEIAASIREVGARFVACVNPISLGLLKPPGEYGADIVVGDGQALGNPLAFGGPYLGFFATTKALMRRIPGRLVGESRDADGRRAYVMTLRTREQDIRRGKATSNICTNHSLNALAACVYLASIGKEGLREVASLNAQKAHYAQARLAEAGFAPRFSSPFFNEFVVECPRAVEELNAALLHHKILGGLPVGRFYAGMERSALIAVTEMRTREEIDALVEALSEASRKA